MERMEDFARQWESFDELYSHLPRWELECQRQNFAETYRRLVGVAPDQRERLRHELNERHQTGDRTVDELIASVRESAATVFSHAGT